MKKYLSGLYAISLLTLSSMSYAELDNVKFKEIYYVTNGHIPVFEEKNVIKRSDFSVSDLQVMKDSIAKLESGSRNLESDRRKLEQLTNTVSNLERKNSELERKVEQLQNSLNDMKRGNDDIANKVSTLSSKIQ